MIKAELAARAPTGLKRSAPRSDPPRLGEHTQQARGNEGVNAQ
jgi:hypothetical protein